MKKETFKENLIMSEYCPILIGDGDEKYRMENGLVDLNRDVLIKLVLYMDKEKIRNIVGMMELFYKWSKARIFYWIRNTEKELPLTYLPHDFNTTEKVEICENTLLWKQSKSATFFVDPEINKDVYKIIVEGESFTNGNFSVGVACKEIMHKLTSDVFHSFNETCSLWSSSIYVGKEREAKADELFFPKSGDAIIGLELDANKHVLYFFVGNEQIPHRVVNIPPSVHFGVWGHYAGTSVKLRSLKKLTKSTVNGSLRCAEYQWNLR